MNIYTPYTYLIGWSNLNLFYYGSRTAKEYKKLYDSGCHPNDLFVTYFTSSAVVHSIYKDCGMPDIIEIRKTFTDRNSCLKWERKVLKRLKVCEKDHFINRDHTQVMEKAIHMCMETISIYNKDTDTCVRWPIDKEIPTGFIKGVKPFSDERKDKISRRKWWLNIKTNEISHSENHPIGDDWILGRNVSNSKSLKDRFIWITNGTDSVLQDKNLTIPDNWKRCKTHKTKPSGKRSKDYIWITDGIVNHQIGKYDDLPESFYKGRTFANVGKDNPSSRECSFDGRLYASLREAMNDNNLSRFKIIKHPSFQYIN